MSPIDQASITSELKRLKPSVAEKFSSACETLAPELGADRLTEWQNICWQLADAGWHGWETTNDFIDVSVTNASKPDRLMDVGRYSLRLVGHSFEPGRTYLKGIAESVTVDDSSLLLTLQETGLRVIERFAHASNLHTKYFKSAFLVAEVENLESFRAWCEIVASTCRLDRQSILTFLDLTLESPSQSWQDLNEVAEAKHQNTLLFLNFARSVRQSIGAVEAELLALTKRFSESQQDISEWLAALSQALPLLSDAQSRVLLEAMDVLPSASHAAALVDSAQALPLDQSWVIGAWLEQLPDNDNDKAVLAYLQLASSVSENNLRALLGKVQLFEEQRAFQLFAEGLCGARLRIEPGESIPTSDGLVIRLPTEVALYSERRDNFRWLKTALVHQLGCYEFGTFELRTEGTVAAFAGQFRNFAQPMLAEAIFAICEAARIDWRIENYYAGSALDLRLEKRAELLRRPQEVKGDRQQLLEVLVQCSLDGAEFFCLEQVKDPRAAELEGLLGRLKSAGASVQDSIEVMTQCYAVIAATEIEIPAVQGVLYRGVVPFDETSMNLQLTALEDLQADLAEEFSDDEALQMHGATDEADMDADELEAGDVENPSAVLPADEELVGDEFDQVDDPTGMKQMQRLQEKRQDKTALTFKYDEWDYGMQDYRRRWCTLFEFREVDQDVDFVPDTLSEHRSLANRVRRQLNMLRPELLRKVKGVVDGEELDLERAIEAMVDKKSGISPSEHIYVQRQRKERDVAALFLLDMSASTDDLIDPVPTVYVEEDDDYLHGFSPQEDEEPAERGKTILDLEKESVVLMAEALEGLGDSYAVCGFSGYGRDNVEYYVCKDFDQPYNYQAKANIGGIKPCRSTRMGPAIRHATKMLSETESRIKALIIISDGYPQDFDYGQDRNSKDYGIKDTTKALTEANQKGVQSFCLTVDPSGHDYLREMCPDQQYMVMQDISQLPDELSKVYRGLTS